MGTTDKIEDLDVSVNHGMTLKPTCWQRTKALNKFNLENKRYLTSKSVKSKKVQITLDKLVRRNPAMFKMKAEHSVKKMTW